MLLLESVGCVYSEGAIGVVVEDFDACYIFLANEKLSHHKLERMHAILKSDSSYRRMLSSVGS